MIHHLLKKKETSSMGVRKKGIRNYMKKILKGTLIALGVTVGIGFAAGLTIILLNKEHFAALNIDSEK